MHLSSDSTLQTYDPLIWSLIESVIQSQHSVDIPAIVFEYLSEDNGEFDYEDLLDFYEKFGEIEHFELKGKKSVILFKTFFAANQCRVFLENKNNYSANMKHEFNVKWFALKEHGHFLPTRGVRSKFQKKATPLYEQNKASRDYARQQSNTKPIMNQFFSSINYSQYINSGAFSSNCQPYYANQYPNIVLLSESMGFDNGGNSNKYDSLVYMNSQHKSAKHNTAGSLMLSPNPHSDLLEHKSSSSSSSSIYSYDRKHPVILTTAAGNGGIMGEFSPHANFSTSNGKFTCKYEILIPNEKEFQIAKKLIGPNGYNMKKIIDECKTEGNEKNVKLRLRGRGSGFKEGPLKIESDEPLHLCVSSRKYEHTLKACLMVNDLLEKTYDDYIRYCHKVNLMPLKQIAVRVHCGNSCHNNSGNNYK